MFNKKIPSIQGVDALLFYSQRLVLIKRDMSFISELWKDCLDPQEYKDDLMTHASATCNRRQEDSPCKSCIDNKDVAKEKRRLKAQFIVTVDKMLTFTPRTPELCYKLCDTFTDIEINKMEYK